MNNNIKLYNFHFSYIITNDTTSRTRNHKGTTKNMYFLSRELFDQLIIEWHIKGKREFFESQYDKANNQTIASSIMKLPMNEEQHTDHLINGNMAFINTDTLPTYVIPWSTTTTKGYNHHARF